MGSVSSSHFPVCLRCPLRETGLQPIPQWTDRWVLHAASHGEVAATMAAVPHCLAGGSHCSSQQLVPCTDSFGVMACRTERCKDLL